MIADIQTIVWKEWKEMLFLRSSRRGGLLASLVLPLGLLGVFLPWHFGANWFQSGGAILWIWMPMFAGSGMVVDSFAGERERKTLETLLASRLSDGSILFGKTAAVVGYSWGIVIASLALAIITLSLVYGRGQLILPTPHIAVGIIGFSLLLALFSSLGGILISLRASTVRGAGQTISLALMFLIFGVVGGAQALPAEWKKRVAAAFSGSGLLEIELTGAAILLIVNAVLLAAARARFKRARLILD